MYIKLIAHISVCLDCLIFFLSPKNLFSLLFSLKEMWTVYNSISHQCTVTFQMYIYIFFLRELATTVLTLRFCHHSLPCPLQISWICSICDPAPFLLPSHDRNFRETTLPINNHCDSKIFVNTCFFVVKHTYICVM